MEGIIPPSSYVNVNVNVNENGNGYGYGGGVDNQILPTPPREGGDKRIPEVDNNKKEGRIPEVDMRDRERGGILGRKGEERRKKIHLWRIELQFTT
jgi:hypothetical protein